MRANRQRFVWCHHLSGKVEDSREEEIEAPGKFVTNKLGVAERSFKMDASALMMPAESDTIRNECYNHNENV